VGVACLPIPCKFTLAGESREVTNNLTNQPFFCQSQSQEKLPPSRRNCNQLNCVLFATNVGSFRKSEHPHRQFRRCNEQALPHPAGCRLPTPVPCLLFPYIVKTLFNQGRSWKFSSWTGNPTVCTRGESTLSNTYCNRFLRSCSSARQAFCCKTENTTLQADSPGFHRLRAGTRPDQGTGVAAHYHPCFQEAVKHYHLL